MFSDTPVKKSARILQLALLFVFLISTAPAQAETVLNKIVAFVNGEIITMYDLQAAVAPELLRSGLSRKNPGHHDQIAAMEKKTLDAMITDELFVQEAERYNIEVKSSELDNEVRKIAQRNNMTLEEAKEQMKMDGVSYESYTDQIRKSILRSRLLSFMVGRKVVVTKEDVQAYYDEHKTEFSSDRKVAVKMLLFAPGADAASVAESVHAGTLSFEDAVAQYSAGPARQNGGLLGELAWMDLSAMWRSALEPLKDGDVTELLDQGGQKMLLKLDHVVPGSVLPLEDVAEKIEDTLRKPMLEARFEEYTAKLRDKAVIKINL